MDEDLDDTVIGPLRRLTPTTRGAESDTIVRERPFGAGLVEPRVEPVPDSEATLPAAAFYQFIVNTHDPIGLDRPAYIGRRPSSPRITQGARPRLVRVSSPRGEVSGTHLELRQQGAMVIVTDLRSTNGTVLRIPGFPPVRLRQGESVVVIPGSIVEIGDGNVIEILPIQRAHPPGPFFGERLS